MERDLRLGLLISIEESRAAALLALLIGLGGAGCTPASQDSSVLSSAPEKTQVSICSDCEDNEENEENEVESNPDESSSPSPSESASSSSTTSVTKDCPEGEYIHSLYLKSDGQGITDIGFKCATEEIASMNPRGGQRKSTWVSLRKSAVFRGTNARGAGIRLAADGPSPGAVFSTSPGSPTLDLKSWLIGASASGSSTTIHTGSTSADKITSITFSYRHSRFCGVEDVFGESRNSTADVKSCDSLTSNLMVINKDRSVSCDNDGSGKLIGGFKAELDEEGHIVSLNARTWIAGIAGDVATDCETTQTAVLNL